MNYRRVWTSLVLVPLGVLVWGTIACAQGVGPNFVSNPGFESGSGSTASGWGADGSIFRRDTAVRRSGAASMKYSNASSSVYKSAGQRMELPPDRRYEVSAWIKTQGISGSGKGATFCLEWWGTDGSFVGGHYEVSAVSGTRNWTKITAQTGRIPELGTRVTLTLYVTRGMTGTAWFDDVSVRRVAEPALDSVLTQPVYRGRLPATGVNRIGVRAEINFMDYEFTPSSVRCRGQLVHPSSGAVLQSVDAIVPDDGKTDVRLIGADLKPGPYTVRVVLSDRGTGKLLATREHALTKPAPDFKAKVDIDAHKRLLVNGKPFFPLGMFWGHITEADLKLHADSGFNTIMVYTSPTKAQMDLAERYGLKVIYGLHYVFTGSTYSGVCPSYITEQAGEEKFIRERVRQFRDHPALLAWYHNDERPASWFSRLEAHYRWFVEEDSHHPTWAVTYRSQDVRPLMGTFDVMGPDYYPIPNQPISGFTRYMREFTDGVSGARPIWAVPQSFSRGVLGTPGGRCPTYEEMRAMAWLCICGGSDGLIFYAYYLMQRPADVSFSVQWERSKRMAADVAGLSDVLLSVESPPAVEVTAGKWLHWTVRRHSNKTYLMVINDGDGEGSAEFRVSQQITRVTVRGEGRTIAPKGNVFTDHFGKFGFHVYEIEGAFESTDTIDVPAPEREAPGACGDATVPSDHMAHWHFDTETNGVTSAADGTSAGVLVNGTKIASDAERGNVASLMAEEGHINVDGASRFDIRDALTLSVWVNVVDYAKFGKILVKPVAGGAEPWELYALDLSGDNGMPRFIISSGTAGEWYGAWDAGFTAPLRKWFHLAATYDGNRMTLYIDGQARPTTMHRYDGALHAVDHVTVKIGTNDEPLRIGAYGEAGEASVNGLLDDLRIYNRALTADEVCALHMNEAKKERKRLEVKMEW